MPGHFELFFALIGVPIALVGILGEIDTKWFKISKLTDAMRVVLGLLGLALFLFGVFGHTSH